MSVTPTTSHSPIEPWGESEQSSSSNRLRHALMAFLSSCVVHGENFGVSDSCSVLNIAPADPANINNFVVVECTMFACRACRCRCRCGCGCGCARMRMFVCLSKEYAFVLCRLKNRASVQVKIRQVCSVDWGCTFAHAPAPPF